MSFYHFSSTSFRAFLVCAAVVVVVVAGDCSCKNGFAEWVGRKVICTYEEQVLSVVLENRDHYDSVEVLQHISNGCRIENYREVVFSGHNDGSTLYLHTQVAELKMWNVTIKNVETVKLGSRLGWNVKSRMAESVNITCINCTKVELADLDRADMKKLILTLENVHPKVLVAVKDLAMDFNGYLEVVSGSMLNLAFITIKFQTYKKSPSVTFPIVRTSEISYLMTIPFLVGLVGFVVVTTLMYQKRQRIAFEIKRHSRRISIAVVNRFGGVSAPAPNATRLIEMTTVEECDEKSSPKCVTETPQRLSRRLSKSTIE